MSTNTPYQLLLVEDDLAVAQSLQQALTREGYAVTWKASGGEGVRHAQTVAPHLILLDIRLPDGSGFDFCRQMRQLGLRQPVIMLTAQAEDVDKILGLEMGADDYVTKPFNLRELLSRIRAQLRRAYGEFSSADANLLLVGDLVIDLARSQAARGNETLSLTPTEFRLLVYLARHRGQALSREQIIEAVWGYSADPESERTVNVHIRRLREKIELDPGQPSLLLTVPGVGYRLARD
ncbi:MAG: winged helix-turn-helix domain-containing protein [Chloroflexota bacterium]